MRHLIDIITRNQTLLESQRTLYHATLARNIPEIVEKGLEPRAGDFVRAHYSWEDDDDVGLDNLVFAADKASLSKCYSAICGYLRLAGIPVNEENVVRYGAICVIKGQNDNFYHHGEQEVYYGSGPAQVEPDDYYSYEPIHPTYILTGKKLARLFRRHKLIGLFSRPPIRESADDIGAAMFAQNPEGEQSVDHDPEGGVYIERIIASEDGKGIGTRAMLAACQKADQLGVRLRLYPDGDYYEDSEAAKERLIRFYKRFGFKMRQDGFMVREPQS